MPSRCTVHGLASLLVHFSVRTARHAYGSSHQAMCRREAENNHAVSLIRCVLMRTHHRHCVPMLHLDHRPHSYVHHQKSLYHAVASRPEPKVIQLALAHHQHMQAGWHSPKSACAAAMCATVTSMPCGAHPQATQLSTQSVTWRHTRLVWYSPSRGPHEC